MTPFATLCVFALIVTESPRPGCNRAYYPLELESPREEYDTALLIVGCCSRDMSSRDQFVTESDSGQLSKRQSELGVTREIAHANSSCGRSMSAILESFKVILLRILKLGFGAKCAPGGSSIPTKPTLAMSATARKLGRSKTPMSSVSGTIARRYT